MRELGRATLAFFGAPEDPLVESAELYRRFDEPWARGLAGLDLSPGRAMAIHGWLKPTTALDPEAQAELRRKLRAE